MDLYIYISKVHIGLIQSGLIQMTRGDLGCACVICINVFYTISLLLDFYIVIAYAKSSSFFWKEVHCTEGIILLFSQDLQA